MYLCPNIKFCAKRASKIIVRPKEMLLLFSIRTFLTNYDVTSRKLRRFVIHSTVRKRTKKRENKSMETIDVFKAARNAGICKIAYLAANL